MDDRNSFVIEDSIRSILGKRGLPVEDGWFRPALDFFQPILSRMPVEDQASIRRTMLATLELNGERLFGDVNMPRGTSPDRQQTLDEIRARLAGRGARHLEMGVHIGFPDNRVADLIKERDLGEFLRLDMDSEVKPDVVADCAHLPFADESLDSVASDSLFEHMRFPHETIRETFRVLAPGGVMQVNMPFFFTIHNYPGDYMRLTPQFFEETCRETGFERVYCHVYDFGGLYYTLHNSSKQVLIDETQEPSVVESSKALHLNVMVLLMLASAFDSLFYGHSRNFFLGVYCAAFKAGEPPQRPSRCSEDNDALNRMLPYLACPTSHQPLIRTTSDNLSTPDGQFVYPVSNGIPILLATPRLGSTLDRVLTCPSCGSMDSVPELSRYDGDFLYDLRKCTTCSLVYLAYQLTTEEVARLEESNPTYTGEKDEAKDLEMLSKLVGFFEKYVPRGRILEVGCSRGFLLKAAANRGWSVTGVELCQSTAAYAHDHLGLPIYNKELSDCPFEERYFDLVVMWHTLEHLKQPGLMLRHIKELLRDGGAVAIQVPSYSLVSKSGDEDLKGRIYCKIHNFQFTKESLRFLLEHQGFRICYLEESKPDCSLTAIARSSTFMPYEEHAPHSASAYSASPYGLREAVSALTYPGAGIFARLARFLILIEHYLVWARVHFREGGPKEVSQRVRHRLRLLFRSEGRDTTRGGNGV